MTGSIANKDSLQIRYGKFIFDIWEKDPEAKITVAELVQMIDEADLADGKEVENNPEKRSLRIINTIRFLKKNFIGVLDIKREITLKADCDLCGFKESLEDLQRKARQTGEGRRASVEIR